MEKTASKDNRKAKNANRSPRERSPNGEGPSSGPRPDQNRKDKDRAKVDFLKNQFKELREALDGFWPQEIDETVEAAVKLMTTQSQKLAQAEYENAEVRRLVRNLKEINQEQQLRLEVHAKVQKDGRMRMLKSACRFHAMIREYTEAHHYISEKEFRRIEERAREHGEAPCATTNDCKGPKNGEGICRSKAWFEEQVNYERECLRSAARVYKDQEKEMAAEMRQLEDEVGILKEKLSNEQFGDLAELEEEFDDVCQRLLKGRFEKQGIKLVSKPYNKRSSTGSPGSRFPRFPPSGEADSDSDDEIIKPPTKFQVIIPKARPSISYQEGRCLPGPSKSKEQKEAEELEFVNRIAKQTAKNSTDRVADEGSKKIKISTVKEAMERHKTRTRAAAKEASQQMGALVEDYDKPKSASRSAREQIMLDTDSETEDELNQSVSIITDEEASQEGSIESIVEDSEESGRKRKRKQNVNNGKKAAKKSKAGD